MLSWDALLLCLNGFACVYSTHFTFYWEIKEITFGLHSPNMLLLPSLKKKTQNQMKRKQSPCFRSSVWFRTNVSSKKQVGWVEGGWMSPAGSGCAHFSWMRTSLVLWGTGYNIWATSIYGLALQFMFYEFPPRQSCSVWFIGVLSGEQSRGY